MKRPDQLSQTDPILVDMNKDLALGAENDPAIKDQQIRNFLKEYPELATPTGLRALERHSRQMDASISEHDPIVTPPDLPLPRSRPPKRVRQ